MEENHTSSNDPKGENLREQLNFLEKVHKLNPNLLYIIQLNPHRIIYINDVSREILGLEPKTVINTGPEIFKNILHEEDYEQRLDNLEKCLKNKEEELCEIDVRIRTASGNWEWFKLKDKIFDRSSEGKVTHIIGTANNIHEQKVWEEKQREEHRRFENAQEIGHIGSYQRKLPGDYFTYSAEFYRILGLEPREEEIHIDEFLSHVHPDDREEYIKAIQHTYATGEPLDIVTRAIRPDGSIRYIQRRAAILKDELGTPVLGYGTGQDITERIKAEEERERLETLMQSTEIVAGTGSYEADLINNKLFFSKGLFRLFGYEPGEFEPTEEWVNAHSHPDDAPVVRQILEEATNNKKGYSYTRRIYRKDGQKRVIESQGSIIVDEKGKPVKFIGLVQDVTARKKAEKSLQESEERSRNLLKVLQNAPDSYLVLTADLVIEMASDAYLEATQTTRKDIIGKLVFDAFPDNPEAVDAMGVKNLKASLQNVLQTRKPDRMPIQHYDVRDKEGSFKEKYWSPTNTPVINAKGDVDYIIHRVLDVTEVMKKQTAIAGLSNETEILKTSLEEIKIQASQLKESRSLLQSIFDASPNSIVLYDILRDRDGKVYDLQFSMVNAFNYKVLEVNKNIIGKRLGEEFPLVKENKTLENFIYTAETGIATDFETWLEGGGYQHWFHYRVTRLEDQLLVTSEDITERKKSEEIIQQMLNGSLSAITILQAVRGEDGEITDFVFKGANKAAEKINSLPAEKMVGQRLLHLFPGVKHVFLDTYINVVETGEPLRVQRQYSYEHLNNWFDVSAVKIGDGIIMTFNDITEQKEAEQELVQLKEELAQRAKDRYRKIINSMDEAYCLMEVIFNDRDECVDYRYLEINPVFEEQAGLQDVLGKRITDLVPHMEDYWFKYYGTVAKTGESLRFEDYSESLERWFDIYAFRLDEQEKNQIGVIFKDITERKAAEDRQTFLLNLNDALRPLADPAEIQITAMNVLGSHLEVTRAFYSEAQDNEETLYTNPEYIDGVDEAPEEINITSYKPELIEQFLNGKTLVINDVLVENVLREESDIDLNNQQVRAGIAVPLIKNEKLVAAIRVHQNTPRRWTPAEVSLVEEVCKHTWAAVERARSGNALRESEQKFRDLVEASALAVWETNPQGMVETDSPSWRTFTGQSFDDWKGYGWLNAVHPEERELVIKNWKEAVAANRKVDTEFRLVGKNGESRWTNVKAIPIISLDGKVTKWAGMNLDIHNMKMTEDALIKAKNEAEAASRAKEDFVSTMSHEIRTPLNAVIGLTNLLLDNNPRDDQKENLNSLSFSAQNLLSLINDILDFSKLEAGKGDVDENVFDLSILVISLQQLYAPQARKNGSLFNLKLDNKIPPRIVTDQLKLSQILHNLVSNAVKFTRDGNIDFSISVQRREHEMLWLEFVIKDTGIGVPREKLAHIFEKFSQAESSTVRQYGGTGLGLTITKLLLELLGSEIKVESQVGQGSKFHFLLPVKEAPLEKSINDIPVYGHEDITNIEELEILLVEDVEINRNILLQFMSNWWQIQPDEALNGKEAVEKATKKKYDMILMDVRMPIMDGHEATKQIRRLPGYKNVPILALTADKNLEVQQEQNNSQFDDLLTKPFDPAQLKRRILHYLYPAANPKPKPDAINGEIKPMKGAPNGNGISRKEQDDQDPIDVSRYTSLAGDNRVLLEKLLGNSLKSIKSYRKEFDIAATGRDTEALSNLIHKNTVTLHYIQANRLGGMIQNYRESLQEDETAKTTEQHEAILEEFERVTESLQKLLEKK
ncbi:PAS domain S-box protein [Antarcticibacterium flavum]|uniref:histidine kinase n=1 Tax=Antarcticibacterium flavum TaxID=2058175 RepID=A0A5B7WZK2_9FLAO|nr:MULTISPECIES: PAS domain-containing protein [Antarcticibacterium]MCM4161246.1 hypothetical protein [Antarcticibacterium sp. W02-3]QCY68437.1 PAS domain S-box protein [Antarcticibacterium flavum]